MIMESTVLDAVWLNESGSCTLVHLAEVSGLESAERSADPKRRSNLPARSSEGRKSRLHARSSPGCPRGTLRPLAETGGNPVFESAAMQSARIARRLRDDFELNPGGLALAMRLLERVDALEREVERLRAGTANPQPRR